MNVRLAGTVASLEGFVDALTDNILHPLQQG